MVLRRLAAAALCAPLALSAAMPVAAAAITGLQGASPAAAATAPAGSEPVQLLSLTTPAGEPTEVGSAGIEDATETFGQPVRKGAAAASAGTGRAARGAFSGMSRVWATLLQAAQPLDPSEALILTEPLQVDDFMVAGVTWTGDTLLPDGLSLYLRVREHGQWSPWYETGAADAGPDTLTSSQRAGTDEFITGGADAVQAAVMGDPSLADSLPRDLQVALIPASPQGDTVLDADDVDTLPAHPTPVIVEDAEEETGLGAAASDRATGAADTGADTDEADTGEAVADTAPATADPETAPAESDAAATQADAGWKASASPTGTVAAAAGGFAGGTGLAGAALPGPLPISSPPLSVVTRDSWGAPRGVSTGWMPEYVSADHVVVHHTAGTNDYTAQQSASIVRGIHHYHAVTLHWGDIGYNFLVDKFGRVFEGRYGSLHSAPGTMVVGGHARGVNTGTMGISMIGDYSAVTPPWQTLRSVSIMSAWFLQGGGYRSTTEKAPVLVRTTEKYRKGTVLQLPRIFAHRDSGATTCPGNAGYAQMDTIRSTAQSWFGWIGRDSGPGRWRGSAGGWWWAYADGSYPTQEWEKINGQWYYFTDDGYMATGWHYSGGHWYYLTPGSGVMYIGWLKDKGAWYLLDRRTGAMRTGWYQEGSTWYHFESSGEMSSGWLRSGSSWYYLDPASGHMVTGVRVIDGTRYEFNSTGVWVK